MSKLFVKKLFGNFETLFTKLLDLVICRVGLLTSPCEHGDHLFFLYLFILECILIEFLIVT